MKKLFILLLPFIVAGACGETHDENLVTLEKPAYDLGDRVYDPDLAAKFEADEYGMSKYVMAFLNRGPKRDEYSKELRDSFQVKHLENIERMAEEGKLVLAGPFLDDQNMRGIYIFNVETIEEARKLTESDPSIQAGILEMELRPWYGSAGLQALTDLHYKLVEE